MKIKIMSAAEVAAQFRKANISTLTSVRALGGVRFSDRVRMNIFGRFFDIFQTPLGLEVKEADAATVQTI